MKKKNFVWKWRPLSRRRRFLKRPFAKKISSEFFFMRNKLVKNYRFQHWLRKHYLPETLNLPYLPPHKEFSISKFMQRLDFVLYDAKFVRSLVQARHFIIKGYVKVDGRIIKDPSNIVKRGSVINLNITNKDLFASAIKSPKPHLYLGRTRGLEQRIFPKFMKLRREDLNWTINLFNKR